jgi:cellulose synthase (UDP-forming)
MDYPNYRVWVLDDGGRPWLQEMCEQLGCGYIARPDNSHAKAGNLNYALAKIAQLPKPPQFVSILDADFVPMPNFLSRGATLFRDETIGIVQTPQHFINPDPIQTNLLATKVLPDEQRFFFDVVMPAKDAWSAAFCCGTSSIIRFAPLMAIGGVPTDSVTEDYLLTLRMKEAGYTTAYLNEPLTLGLAPEGLKEYISQRGRWCLGFMQITRGRSGPFSLTSKLTFIDRLSLVDTFLMWGPSIPPDCSPSSFPSSISCST